MSELVTESERDRMHCQNKIAFELTPLFAFQDLHTDQFLEPWVYSLRPKLFFSE